MTKSSKESPKFYCPLFNFEIDNQKENSDSIILLAEDKTPFKRLKFVGNTTLKGIKKSQLQTRDKSITRLFLEQHVAGVFLSSFKDLPVIEIYQEENIVPLIESIILALRIFKEGDVFCKIIWSDDHNEHTVLNPFYELPNTLHYEIYSLKTEEIDQINEIFKMLIKSDFIDRRHLRIACDRLNRSYGKSMYDEKMLDFMIAFEALFMRKTSPNIGVVIATACSMLLGESDLERKEIYEFFVKAYKLRNKIVHGSAVDFSEIRETALRLKEHLRESILKLL